MQLVFDAPMAARQGQEALGPGRQAGDDVGDLDALLVADLARALDAGT
jgi:hypothetical protein